MIPFKKKKKTTRLSYRKTKNIVKVETARNFVLWQHVGRHKKGRCSLTGENSLKFRKSTSETTRYHVWDYWWQAACVPITSRRSIPQVASTCMPNRNEWTNERQATVPRYCYQRVPALKRRIGPLCVFIVIPVTMTIRESNRQHVKIGIAESCHPIHYSVESAGLN